MAASKRSSATLVIILGISTALVGAVLAAVLLLANDGESDKGASGTVPVLIATKAIPRGASGAQVQASVAVRQVSPVARASDALVSVEQLADRTTTAEIGADQQIRSAFFRQRTVKGSAISVPDGKQGVAVTIGFTPAGAGYIAPGDKVNVYSLFTKQGETVVVDGKAPAQGPEVAADRLLFSNIEVLDVSQEVAPLQPSTATPSATAARAAPPASTITYLLAVDANQAERLIFFAEYAKLYLTLVPHGQPDSATSGRDQTNVLR